MSFQVKLISELTYAKPRGLSNLTQNRSFL